MARSLAQCCGYGFIYGGAETITKAAAVPLAWGLKAPRAHT